MSESLATAPPSAAAREIDTKKVTNRRTLRFHSYADLVADAEQLASVETRTVGNWTHGEILDHLSKSINMMIDGSDFLMPAPVRFLMRLLMKKKFLTRSLPPGFRIPRGAEQIQPKDDGVDKGLDTIRKAVERAKSEDQRALHPVFGRLTSTEWDQFQLRHCEMHMSFVLPLNSVD